MTENAVKQAFHRLRQRYRKLLREESRTRWQRRPRLKMNSATSSPRCARNLFGISVNIWNEGNGRAMRITTGKFCRKCGAAIPPDSPQQSCGACLLETGLGSRSLSVMKVDRLLPKVEPIGEGDNRASPMLMDFGDYELLEQSVAAVRAWYFAPGRRVSIAQSH